MITQKSLIEKYSGGFQMYHDSDKQKQFADNWLLDKNNSNDKRLCFQAYDANLMPLPNITGWPKHAQKEMIQKITEKFKGQYFEVYLDGHLLDRKNQKLIV